jgi:hypothetical protein
MQEIDTYIQMYEGIDARFSSIAEDRSVNRYK